MRGTHPIPYLTQGISQSSNFNPALMLLRELMAEHSSQSEQAGAEEAQRAGLGNGAATVVVVNLECSSCIRGIDGVSIAIAC
jgi:hypothetical protein